MSGRLEGTVALVTGAARGQGRSHAVHLAAEGADVIGLDLCAQVESIAYPLATPEDLAETVREVERLDRRMIAGEVDVRDLAGLETFVGKAVAELGGRLDVVVANAGIAGTGDSTLEMTPAQWADMIDVNLTGVWHTAKVAVPHMVAAGRGGALVITTSVAGSRAYAGIGHYVAAKHGATGLMKALALELAPHRIRVNAVAPTNVDTPMIQNEQLWRRTCPDVEQPTRADYESRARSINVLDEAWVDPSDVSEAMVYLAAESGRYLTGTTLPIDLGRLLR
ncbi:mycofactocin-coupled SDR family oxidoreductase [Pseudonocardia ailaonensis]|uniref:Mycofactocin-coupled SDR family oxidoreductase n=1 Tax=Pseudonocardia ailaonensis TaxID=367279 RepID=A0ABN2NHN2_9PSEU